MNWREIAKRTTHSTLRDQWEFISKEAHLNFNYHVLTLPQIKKKCYYCYILAANQQNATYCGCTNNVPRRLRQHNGLIKGGARSTRRHRGAWKYAVVVGPFLNKKKALRFEACWKHTRRKKCLCRGPSAIILRLTALASLLILDEWNLLSIYMEPTM
jgi:predicted GIY-YIG superfamily endonuclease